MPDSEPLAQGPPSVTAFEALSKRSSGFRTALNICLSTGFPSILYWGPDFHHYFNDAYARMRGATAESFGGSAKSALAENWPEIEPMLRNVVATGVSGMWEDFYLTIERDEEPAERYFTFSMSRVRDEFGASGVLCIALETTARILQLRGANERIATLSEFQKLADNISDIVYMHESSGTISWANERFYAYTGLPRDSSFALETVKRITPPEDFERYVAALEAAMPEQAPYEIEVQLKPIAQPTDAFRYHLIRGKPMFDDDGILLRWAGSATDIHDRRIAEDRQRRASLAFQVAALPKSLPTVPGLTFSAVYQAAEAEAFVGGDWYDAFRLSDGRIVLSIGDVMGSGLAAAVTMAAVRQAIRGAAQIYPDPASVLDAADRALRSEEPDGIVTAFVAVLDPLSRNLSFASAGHPAPMVRLPTGEIVELSAPDLPLGLRSERRRTKATQPHRTIEGGALLVLYTDGLTETTRDVAEGERRLREALAAVHAYPQTAAERIRDLVLASSTDDVAILTVLFDVAEPTADAPHDLRTRWSFPIADATAAASVRRELVDGLRGLGASANDAADAELVLGELLGNVMRHAGGDVAIVLDLSAESPVLHVMDDGPGFTFHARLPPDDLAESGRGLYIAAMLTKDCTVAPRAEGGSHARVVLNVGPLRG